MDFSFLIQLLIVAFIILLLVLGYEIVRRTKDRAKETYAGSAAKSMGSLFSPHLRYIKEMKGMIVNEVKKTEPRDDDE